MAAAGPEPPVMPFPFPLPSLNPIAWLRDLLGIRKDIRDAKKAGLEIRKLEHEQQQRQALVTPASFEDVRRYDPKLRELLTKCRD